MGMLILLRGGGGLEEKGRSSSVCTCTRENLRVEETGV